MPWRKGNRLRTIAEQDAEPATRQIYAGIKDALRLPGLPLYYPALGNYPRFLTLHWEVVRNVALSPELLSSAERLRADAYTRAHNYFQIPDLRRYTQSTATTLNVANFFDYLDPLMLLLFIFQIQAMEGPTGKLPDRASETTDSPGNLQCAVTQLPPDVSEADASVALRKKYDDIRRTLGTPFVGPEFCSFAAQPEFLAAFWGALKPMVGSPLYPACKHGIRSGAWSIAAQLPGPAELPLDRMSEAGLSPEDITSAARILDLFVDYLTGSLLNVAIAKIAIEGGNLVTSDSPAVRQRKQPAA